MADQTAGSGTSSQNGKGAKGAGSGGQTPAVSTSGNTLTISLSAVIAAMWAGIWGYNWAATHLASGMLFITVVAGLSIGAVVTYHLTSQTFRIVEKFEDYQYKLQDKALDLERYKAEHGQPAGGQANTAPDGSHVHVSSIPGQPPVVVPGKPVAPQ